MLRGRCSLPNLYKQARRHVQGRGNVDKAVGFASDPRRTTIIRTPSCTSIIIITNTKSNGACAVAEHVVALVRRKIDPRGVLKLAFAHGTTSRLLSQISTTIAHSRHRHNLGSTGVAFLGPRISACSTFFRSVIHRCKLLINFSRGARPLDRTNTVRLVRAILSERVSSLVTFSNSLGSFGAVTNGIFTLSGTVSNTVVNNSYADFSRTIRHIHS